MSIEAELKAHVRFPAQVRELLCQRAPEEATTYTDTYYDRPDESLTASGRELRVRTITGPHAARTRLTYKDQAVDPASGSKPEYETHAEDPAILDAIFLGLGYHHLISFQKHCLNYAYTAHKYDLITTLATVPELDGTFIEIETQVDAPADLPHALVAIRTELAHLGISSEDLTTELYTAAVAKRRGQRH
ncbi:class IV adenylate cyclase [Nonomuraea purpurea]|uniref:Class IV adenylate cyclase n=1 Tax=Nonomuraea purpurea TaxID=1849276 RepID=A0ABV8G4V8_9ACTN